jgi:hypothetical protein
MVELTIAVVLPYFAKKLVKVGPDESFFQTMFSVNQYITLDLEKESGFKRVEVYNRKDATYQPAYPLTAIVHNSKTKLRDHFEFFSHDEGFLPGGKF